MKKPGFITLAELDSLELQRGNRFYSATFAEIEQGLTSDIYFVRTRDLLTHMGLEGTPVTAEVFSSKAGILAGIDEAMHLLRDTNLQIWTLPDGSDMEQREVVMRIKGKYGDFGIYETPLLGILASSSGWASAARACKEAAGGRRVLCYGARHLHPAVAPVMERAAVTGGADGCSCILAALLMEKRPAGTVPHAAFLIVGDTVKLARAYDSFVHPDDPRIILVDTFKDEAEEALRVAEAMGERLDGIRLDTPGERGGVTPGLIREVRARLNLAGFSQVQIIATGGLDPDRIKLLAEAGADAFGVGSFISRSPAIDMTMDLKEVKGVPVAKRGRLPGITENSRLVRVS